MSGELGKLDDEDDVGHWDLAAILLGTFWDFVCAFYWETDYDYDCGCCL